MDCKNCTRIRFLIILALASALYFHGELKQIISTSEIKLDGEDLVERDGVYFKRFSEVPFNGRVTGEEQGTLKNGKKQGAWITFRRSGQLYKKES